MGSETLQQIAARFFETGYAAEALASLTAVADGIARTAFADEIARLLPIKTAIFATGWYARGETFPFADAEILILVEDAVDPNWIAPVTAAFRQRGLLASVTASRLADCVDWRKYDLPLACKLLERRFLAGDENMADQLDRLFPLLIAKNAHRIAAELAARARVRHAARGNTPNWLQPDVVEDPGGLRDLRLLDRLEKLSPGRNLVAALQPARGVMLTTRCFLHFRAGTDSNRVDFARDAALPSPPFSISPARYFASVRGVFQEARHALDRLERKPRTSLIDSVLDRGKKAPPPQFRLTDGHLELRSGDVTWETIAQAATFVAHHGVPLSEELQRSLQAVRRRVTPNAEVWPWLRDVLSAPHSAVALRMLHATGWLAALLPGWEQLESSAGRRYTAEEHALQAVDSIEALHEAAEPSLRPFAALLGEIDMHAVLLFALVTADLPALPAAIGMATDERSVLDLLLANRNALSAGDPVAIAHMANTVERLRLLTLFRYANLAAAGQPEALEDLFRIHTLTKEELTRELETERIEHAPEDLAEAEDFVTGFPVRYLHVNTPERLAAHHRLYKQSRPTGAAAGLEPEGTGYRVTIVARDRPYLFAAFASAITASGLDIEKAEAFSNVRGIILDTFLLADPKSVLQRDKTAADRLLASLERAATGRTDAVRPSLPARPKESKKRAIPPSVRFDSAAYENATLVEVVAENRPGLLCNLATVFSAAACNIDVVLIDTKENRAIDIFYVAHEGRALTPDAESALREKLLAAC